MKIVKPLIALVLVCAALFGLNMFTGPIIAENAASAVLGPLANVLPGAANFDELDCADLPETVQAIYSEKSGLGYAVQLSTTAGYTGEPIELALGVSADGKITGTELTAFNDTRDLTPEFLESFNGKDSALADVDLIAGTTYSSAAVKNAVEDALVYMADNGMITAGVKGDDQVLKEILPQVFPGMANAEGILQMTEDSTDELMIAMNNSGVAGLVDVGGKLCLQVININGDVKTVDAEGNEVEAEAMLDASSAASTADADKGKIEKLVDEGATLEEIPLTGVFNCVTSAFKVNDDMYAFGTRPYAYSNELMPVYFVINSNGEIVKMNAPEFILYSEYFSSYTLDKESYKEGFAGQTAASFTDDTALISGATVSSNAIAMATKAAFEAFELVKGGNAA